MIGCTAGPQSHQMKLHPPSVKTNDQISGYILSIDSKAWRQLHPLDVSAVQNQAAAADGKEVMATMSPSPAGTENESHIDRRGESLTI